MRFDVTERRKGRVRATYITKRYLLSAPSSNNDTVLGHMMHHVLLMCQQIHNRLITIHETSQTVHHRCNIPFGRDHRTPT